MFIMESLTVLYMIMAFLFMDSRYSRQRTLFMFLLCLGHSLVAVVALYPGGRYGYLLDVCCDVISADAAPVKLSRFRGWRLIFQQLFCRCSVLYLWSPHLRDDLLPVWQPLLGGACPYAVHSTGVIWFLIRFLRPLFSRCCWSCIGAGG